MFAGDHVLAADDPNGPVTYLYQVDDRPHVSLTGLRIASVELLAHAARKGIDFDGIDERWQAVWARQNRSASSEIDRRGMTELHQKSSGGNIGRRLTAKGVKGRERRNERFLLLAKAEVIIVERGRVCEPALLA